MQHGSFLFGASTSAHQVEGGNTNNDWWEYERTLPPFMRSGKAANHFHLYKDDIALAASLGHNAHRISLEWSRIEPQEGKFNRAAIEHYRNVLSEIRSRGMKAFVTLHHFTNPVWFARRGGWESTESSELFNRYVRYAGQQLGDVVDFWITINEPNVYALKSYGKGAWPPKKKSALSTIRVVRNLARAHIKAYRSLHQLSPKVPVGIAQHVVANLLPAENFLFTHSFFLLTKRTHDFIGVNYYFSRQYTFHIIPPFMRAIPVSGTLSDIAWPIYPEGLTRVLLDIKRYKKPIYVTENGLADTKDSRRADFIRSHVRAIEKAQSKGADVRGYLHWSLLDNFEWADGFAPRFGLVAVDYKTMERTVRPSAWVYKAIIEQSHRK
jgi:beta-glucosidase